tara:strand:+ start:208 stop:663 length:456 start_codon:yes stop_codon:yes gene_type:complete
MGDEELSQKELEELEELALRTGQHGNLENQEEEVQKKIERDINIEKVILTTAYEISNREVNHEIEVITSECVYGMNVFRDMFAGARDFFGGRSVATQKVLNDLRETCLYELKALAYEKGADAVIAIDLDYSEFSGGMLFLVASGTAVKLKE